MYKRTQQLEAGAAYILLRQVETIFLSKQPTAGRESGSSRGPLFCILK